MTTYPRDDSGNIQVDFVWGNIPLQPNEDRGMATLDDTLDNHTIATEGWSNYPQYIPNYNGLELFDALGNVVSNNSGYYGDSVPDPELEVVVPNFVRLTISAANDLAAANNLTVNTISHYLTVSYVESTGKTVRVTAYDTQYNQAANASNEALVGLDVGDQLYFTDLLVDTDPTDFGTITVTKVNNDGDNSWFEFKSSTNLNLDAVATGYVWAGPNLVNIVTVQRPNQTAPGKVVNEGRFVNLRYISVD